MTGNTDRIRTRDLFDLKHTLAAGLLAECEYPWEALSRIGETILRIGAELPLSEYDRIAKDIWTAKCARISPSAHISGPCIIGKGSELRPGAYIRGNVLVGEGAVVGNSTELKNCILFDGVQTPHYNYVGDSILGFRAHMGAGAVASNVKGDRSDIVVHGENEYPTGLRKFGAMIGDMGEIGCGSVLNPGAVIGRGSQVYPLSGVRGIVPENAIFKGERGIFIKNISE